MGGRKGIITASRLWVRRPTRPPFCASQKAAAAPENPAPTMRTWYAAIR